MCFSMSVYNQLILSYDFFLSSSRVDRSIIQSQFGIYTHVIHIYHICVLIPVIKSLT